MLAGVVIGKSSTSSRSGNGRRVAYWRVARVVASVGDNMCTICDIDPDDPSNMRFLLAFECTQAAPESLFLNETVPQNM